MNYTLVIYYPSTKNIYHYFDKYALIENIKLRSDLISKDPDAFTTLSGSQYWFFYVERTFLNKNYEKITDYFDNIINKTINLSDIYDSIPMYISMNNYTQEYIWINNDLKDKIIDNVNLQLKLKTMFNY